MLCYNCEISQSSSCCSGLGFPILEELTNRQALNFGHFRSRTMHRIPFNSQCHQSLVVRRSSLAAASQRCAAPAPSSQHLLSEHQNRRTFGYASSWVCLLGGDGDIATCLNHSACHSPCQSLGYECFINAENRTMQSTCR